MSPKKFSAVLGAAFLVSLAAGLYFHQAVTGVYFVTGLPFFLHAAACAFAFFYMAVYPDRFLEKKRRLAAKVLSLPASVRAAAAFLVLLAALYAVNRWLLLRFMNSGDEHSCSFMAQYFLREKLWADPHPLKEFFSVTHIGDIGGKWFSVYPPGWPLVWAAGISLGLTHLINPLLTAAGALLWLAFGVKIYGRPAAAAAFLFLLFSPFFLFTGASYYSHPLCLFLMGAFFLTAWHWKDKNQPFLGLAAGLLLGAAFGTRYLTAAFMAFPAVMFLLPGLLKTARGRAGFLLFSAGAGSLVLLHAWYNFKITGSFFDAPNHYLHSHEKLGFISGYTPLTGMQYLGQRILYAVEWTSPFVTAIFLLLCLCRASSSWIYTVRLSALLLPAAYFLYYSWGGNQYGPRYLYELYPVACLETASWLRSVWEKSGAPVRKGLLGFFFASLIGGGVLIGKHGAYFRQVSGERKAAYDAAEAGTKKPALVFLSGFLGDRLVMAPDDTVRNTPFLDSPVVYAHDLGELNPKLEAYFPERSKYRLSYDRSAHRAVLKELAVKSVSQAEEASL